MKRLPNERIAGDLISETDEIESLYSAEYLRECATPEARKERLEELRRRIQAKGYAPDPERIAEELLGRALEE